MELSTVAQKVKVLLRQEQEFLTLAAKNQVQADTRAFKIGELIWKEVLQGRRGQRGEGQLRKFLPQAGLQKSAAYNYVNLYRGAEDIMGGLRGGQETEETFKQFRLPREYWQILGSTFNDDTYFTDWVRFILVREPLLTDGKTDKKLLAEAAKLYRIHRKKPNWWNLKRSELKLKPIADNEFGGTWGYFDPADDDDNAAFAKFQKQKQTWERELSLLVAQDRRPPALQSPKLDLSQRLTVSEIGRQVKKDEREEADQREIDDYNRNLKQAKKEGMAIDESKLFRFDRCSFLNLDLSKSPMRKGEKPAAVISDPPYLKKFVRGDRTNPEGLIRPFAKWSFEVLDDGGIVAVMMGALYHYEVHAMFIEAGFKWRWTLTAEYEAGKWARVLKNRVLTCSKPILLFQKGKFSRQFLLGDIIHCGNKAKSYHVWQQDVETFEQVVSLLTDPGDLVVDPFGGTGTTGIACLNLKRRFIGSELDPKTHRRGLNRLRRCVHQDERWERGYQEPKPRPVFDYKTGRRIWGAIEVGVEVGKTGEMKKVNR